MLNPDGVVFGNYRTSLIGRDLNRSFKINDKTYFPTINAMIQEAKLLKAKYGDKFIAFFDIHGHS